MSGNMCNCGNPVLHTGPLGELCPYCTVKDTGIDLDKLEKANKIMKEFNDKAFNGKRYFSLK